MQSSSRKSFVLALLLGALCLRMPSSAPAQVRATKRVLIFYADQGRTAGNLVSWVLKGERPQDISIAKSASVYMIDSRTLQRWGFRESDLPVGSEVLYRESTMWERYKWRIIGTLLLILAQASLSTYLLFERRQRRRAEEQRRRTEEERPQLSRMLIKAQEEERSRLARELHDDFSQRLAALAVGLEAAEQIVSETRAKQKLNELFCAACEIGADLHSLSHRLHSATLENLGLIAGLTSLCGEFAAQQHIEIDFTHKDIPRSVPADVALCLFRVVQEGLRNVKKHSGAPGAKVRLEKLDDQFHLSVSDEGAGFDQARRENKGLGIRSMEERLRLLGGRLKTHSEAGKGTRVDGWVPISATMHVSARESGVSKATGVQKHG